MNTINLSAPLTIEAAQEKGGPRKFNVNGYTGGALKLKGFPLPVVVDLAGVTHSKNIVANRGHDGQQIVGHVTNVANDGKGLQFSGLVSGAGAAAQEVLAAHDNGFPWQASIEADELKLQELPKGQTVTVNHQQFTGPLLIARQSRLNGLAFVPNGADENTTVSIAAQAKKGFDQMELDTTTITAERQRIDRIEAACKGEWGTQAEHVAELKAAAVNNTISFEGLQGELLQAIRAKRPQAASFTRGSAAPQDGKVIEAALAMSAGLPDLEKHYKPETLQAVDDAKLRHFGLQQLLIQAAAANGYDARPGERVTLGNLRSVLEYAFPPAHARIHASQFSTVSLPGILGNVANKEILQGFAEEDATWRDVAATKPVSNLQQATSYRLTDSLEYERLGPTGEIKHGTLGEESYTRQAHIYAKMLGLSQEHIINDDLGAFDEIRTRIGWAGAVSLSERFWTVFINNSSFFTTGRANYITGSTTNLGTDGVGLGLTLKAFRTLESADGRKIGGQPVILLVPPELEANADKLYVGGNGDMVSVSDANPYRGKYKPVVQPRLSDSGYTGYSTTAFYLFRAPTILAPMVVSFLNGQQTPTVESTDADFNTLGILFRGTYAFGCDQAEYLSGVKSKGAS